MKTLITLLCVILLLSCTDEQVEPVKLAEVKEEIKKPVIAKDTVIVKEEEKKDSVIIEEEEVDTCAICQFWIDPAYEYLVRRFYDDAAQYGWTDLQKSNLIMRQEWEPMNTLSASERYENGQWLAKINAMLRHDRMLAPVYRELAHILLGKAYADSTADEVMNPYFTKAFTGGQENELIERPYLNKLFEK